MRRFIGLLVLLSSAMMPSLGAQINPITVAVDSGIQIRMQVEHAPPFRGRLIQALKPTDTQIHYCRLPGSCEPSTNSTAFRTQLVSQLQKLEVQRGTHGPRYGLIGLAIGVVAGYAIGRQTRTNCDFVCRTNETSGAIAGAVTGGLLGVGVGLMLPTFGPTR